MARRCSALLVALPLLLAPAACGGDDDETTSDDATTTTVGGADATDDTTAAEETTTSVAPTDDEADDVDPGADQARVDTALEAILGEVTAAGFAPNPDDEDDDDGGFQFESAECRAFDEVFDGDAIERDAASAESGEYARGEIGPNSAEETLEVNVALVDDTAPVDAVFAVIGDERLPGCMEEALRLLFEQRSAEAAEQGGLPITVEELTVERLPASGIGEQTAGVSIRCVLVTAGLRVPFVLEVEFGRVGRAVAMVLVGIVGSDTLNVQRAVLLDAALRALTAPA